MKKFLFSTLALCWFSGAAFAQSATVAITDSRPVMTAVLALEKVYGIPITYEDTVYLNPGLQEEVGGVAYIPKKVSLTFGYQIPPSDATVSERSKMAESALLTLIANYQDGRAFKVVAFPQGLHVIAAEYVDASGAIQPFTPHLDTPVVAPENVNLVDAIWSAILAAKGDTMSSDHTMLHLVDVKTAQPINNQSARSLLEPLSSARVPQSWDIVCAASTTATTDCYMTLHPVPKFNSGK